MASIREQLQDVFEQSELSVQQLSDRLEEQTGRAITRSSLDRKLKGEIPTKLDEAVDIAATLGQEIVMRPGRGRAA